MTFEPFGVSLSHFQVISMKVHHYPHSLGEETEAQRDFLICSKSQG